MVEKLVLELKSNEQKVQPIINEQEFANGQLRVAILWDEWRGYFDEDRNAIILKAYEEVEGEGFTQKIVLVNGLTIPEAYAAGMLPFRVYPAVRNSDPVSHADCHEAMKAIGASLLFGDEPQLWVGSEEDARETIELLVEKLPKSEPVWIITKDVGKVDEFWP